VCGVMQKQAGARLPLHGSPLAKSGTELPLAAYGLEVGATLRPRNYQPTASRIFAGSLTNLAIDSMSARSVASVYRFGAEFFWSLR
jgi:hypothetical protein